MSSAGSDAKISGSKIEPLDSAVKSGEPSAESSGGSAGTDQSIDRARLDPVGGAGQHQNPASHADDHGSVGRDADIQSAKIEPLDPLVAQPNDAELKAATGLKDEEVDGARIEPMGSVREELK